MTDTTEKTWEEMTPEEQAEFQRASDARYAMYKYNQYQPVVDAITERYDVDWSDALEAAATHVEGLEEEAAEEARREANDNNADAIAEELAQDNGWELKEEYEEE